MIFELLLDTPRRDWNAFFQSAAKARAEAEKARDREREAKGRQGPGPSCDLTAYAGTYEDPVYGTARVVLEGGKLEWRWGEWRFPLRRYQRDTFIAASEIFHDPEAAFQLNGDKEVTGLRLLDMDFKKKR